MMKYRAHRHPTRFPVTLETNVGRSPTTLSNISASGASIEIEGEFPIGKQVILDYAGNQLRATVCWSTEDMAGVAFGRPLSAAEVEKFRYQSPSMPHGRPSHIRQTVGFKMLG